MLNGLFSSILFSYALRFILWGAYKTYHHKTTVDVYEGWILIIGVAAAALAQTLALTQV